MADPQVLGGALVDGRAPRRRRSPRSCWFRVKRIRFRDYADAFALGIAPGWGVARIGCFTVHDHPGVHDRLLPRGPLPGRPAPRPRALRGDPAPLDRRGALGAPPPRGAPRAGSSPLLAVALRRRPVPPRLPARARRRRTPTRATSASRSRSTPPSCSSCGAAWAFARLARRPPVAARAAAVIQPEGLAGRSERSSRNAASRARVRRRRARSRGRGRGARSARRSTR